MQDKDLYLYHYPLDPFCRKVRLMLLEKGMPIKLILTSPWERDTEFLKKNPLGTVPLLQESNDYFLSGNQCICEYINEIKPSVNLLGESQRGRAEIRRLTEWLDGDFYQNAIYPIILEKIYKSVIFHEAPQSSKIRIGEENLKKYMKYLNWIAERRPFLGGKSLSIADLSAAAHFSVLDYLGDLDFLSFDDLKLWYAKIKSRPSFAQLIADRISGITPSKNYNNLDSFVGN